MSIINKKKKLQKLKKQGILTETELENEKKKISCNNIYNIYNFF